MTRLQEGVVAFPLSPISKRLCWPPVGLRVGTDIKHPFFAREDSSGLWRGAGTIRLEQDVFSALAGQGQIYVHLTDGIWSQIKSAGYGGPLMRWLGHLGVEISERWGQALLAPEPLLPFVSPSSALYASRLYLGRYQLTHPEYLAKHNPGGPRIRGTHSAPIPSPLPPTPVPSALRAMTPDLSPEVKFQSLPSPNQIWFGVFVPRSSLLLLGNVYIHPTAKVAPSAVVSGGPAQDEEGGCQDGWDGSDTS